MKLIAAVDNNWAIGYKGRLLASIRADQMNFKKLTLGRVVVLGRKTMETFPGGRPLVQRRNIILSRNPDYEVKGAEVVHSKEELLELIKDVDTDDVFIIGGESLYHEFLPLCDTAIITKINYSYEADAYFPNLDKDEEWECVEEGEEQTCFDMEFKFLTYKRRVSE
ncbi:MAG: dihydrofolate reductase [Lachnospiraceae bacterium]|nr:dihydrofolate reductase [Lachnospiraceae bacterium]